MALFRHSFIFIRSFLPKWLCSVTVLFLSEVFPKMALFRHIFIFLRLEFNVGMEAFVGFLASLRTPTHYKMGLFRHSFIFIRSFLPKWLCLVTHHAPAGTQRLSHKSEFCRFMRLPKASV